MFRPSEKMPAMTGITSISSPYPFQTAHFSIASATASSQLLIARIVYLSITYSTSAITCAFREFGFSRKSYNPIWTMPSSPVHGFAWGFGYDNLLKKSFVFFSGLNSVVILSGSLTEVLNLKNSISLEFNRFCCDLSVL